MEKLWIDWSGLWKIINSQISKIAVIYGSMWFAQTIANRMPQKDWSGRGVRKYLLILTSEAAPAVTDKIRFKAINRNEMSETICSEDVTCDS